MYYQAPTFAVTKFDRFVDKLEFVHPRAPNIDIAEIADEIDDVMESWSTRKYEVYLTLYREARQLRTFKIRYGK